MGDLWAPGRNVRFEEIDALIRALVTFEWAQGEPFRAIRERIRAVTVRPDLLPATTRPGRDRSNNAIKKAAIQLHAADVLQLVEQLAGFLAAAADVVDTNRARPAKHLLDNLAKTVGAGVPLHLVPLANLRIPALQRERLAELSASVDPRDASWENMPDLLDRPDVNVRPQDRERVEKLYWDRLTESGHTLRHDLLHPQATVITEAHHDTDVDEAYDDGPQTFDDWLRAAQNYDAEEQRTAWKELLTTLGVKVDMLGARCQQWGELQPVRVRIPDGEVKGGDLSEVSEELVICWRGMSDRASVLTSQGVASESRFVEPQHLLSRIAWTVHLHRVGEFPEHNLPDLLLDVLRANADPRLAEVPAEHT
ncbi:hypothetical protein [Streptomyces sp. WAC00263]|uniref:hypothetical protein n=1 Tax=Streptomyces sp. WAC00263 TaxID=1917422 RepID=UPI0015EE513D|nr:hypothetical protein [Streptomyces sp. WAC00263]